MGRRRSTAAARGGCPPLSPHPADAAPSAPRAPLAPIHLHPSPRAFSLSSPLSLSLSHPPKPSLSPPPLFQFGVAAGIIRDDGFGSLYKGLSAGILRQATYTTARLGIFNSLSESLKEANKGAPLPLWQKAAAGLTAGGLGALVGSPADLTLIRMQADTTLPVAQRRNYKGVVDAMSRIVREDGVGGLFRGAGPTVVRAMALNMGMLASNDQVKEMIADAGYPGQPAVVVGSLIAGFFAAACSLPFDYVKTQIQEMKAGPDGKLPYKGPLDCAAKTLAAKGPFAFYTGVPTYCVRIAPHAVITLLVLAQLPKWEAQVGL